MIDRYEEARRLLDAGLKLCELHHMSKQPKGDDWNHRLLTSASQVREDAGGFGIPLAVNGLCSVDFDNVALAALVGPVFDRIAGSMVDAFIKRAEQVYG